MTDFGIREMSPYIRKTLPHISSDTCKAYVIGDMSTAIVKWFQWYGERKCLTDKTLGRMSGRKKMASEQQLALKAFVLKNPELYLDEIQSNMINLGFPKIHPSTIYKYLKRLGLSLNSLTAIVSELSEHLSLA